MAEQQKNKVSTHSFLSSLWNLLLAIVLAVSLCPSYALATEQTVEQTDTVDTTDTESTEAASAANEDQQTPNQGVTDATENEDDGLVQEPSAQEQAIVVNDQNNESSEDAVFDLPTLDVGVHIQNIGDKTYSNVNGEVVIGTTGQSKRLEGITLNLADVPQDMSGSIRYTTHIQNKGWQDWVEDGAFSGTKGQSLRLEAIKIELTGDLANNYDIFYRAHAQNYGWLDWTKNGEAAGTEGFGYRLEAIQVCILPKDSSEAPAVGSNAHKTVIMQAKGHSQNIGWQTNNYDSLDATITMGTTGKSKRLEAFSITSAGLEGLSYSAHVANIGWQEERSIGQVAGTTGQSKSIEAVKFNLPEDLSSEYDIYYRAHVANIGWLDWAKNGEVAGTEGYAVNLEAIQVKLVPKDAAAPGATAVHNIDASTVNAISLACGYQVAAGSWGSASVGSVAGTTGQSKALTGVKLKVASSSISGGVTYRAHVANKGWLSYVSDDTESASGSNAVQAVQIKLTGDLSKYFDIYYQAHVAGYGWMGWAKNGSSSGTTGLNKNLEAYRVKIVPKGAAAPGSTAKSFSDQNGFLGIDPRYVKYINKANGYTSSTSWIILVDLSAHRTVILHGKKGAWTVSKYVSCVTGAPLSPTIRGRYATTGYKKLSLSTDRRARYCTQIHGGYYFHSILASNSELGYSLSHGCVRLALGDAIWVYNNIPGGTTVVLY